MHTVLLKNSLPLQRIEKSIVEKRTRLDCRAIYRISNMARFLRDRTFVSIADARRVAVPMRQSCFAETDGKRRFMNTKCIIF